MRKIFLEERAAASPWARRGFLMAGVVLALGACTSVEWDPLSESKWDPVASYHHTEPDPLHFEVCYNHGCADRAEVSWTISQWTAVHTLFEPTPTSAEDERERIAAAVALMERMTGEQAGTDGDVGGTFSGMGHMRQLDCVDETVNTTTYLILLREQGLIRWHVLDNPATRGYFVTGWPHATAVIEEKDTGERFAVDSWFGNNGEPPAIVALPDWYDGWKPGDA